MDWQKEIDEIARWMRDYAEKAGTKGYVLGLSGGIDSAVVACLAVKAMGKGNVYGVSLPYGPWSDSTSLAASLTFNLNISNATLNIKPACEKTMELLEIIGFKPMDQIRIGNIKARERMKILYDIAAQKKYLVAGTGNKSELDIGYNTKHGDGGVDIEPIGNYYKTEIYEMAKLMPEIPEETITRPPSAELWDGQTDEDEIGMSYKELDEILKRITGINLNNIDIKCICEYNEFKMERMQKVVNMVKSSQHKNKLPPRCPRIDSFTEKSLMFK